MRRPAGRAGSGAPHGRRDARPIAGEPAIGWWSAGRRRPPTSLEGGTPRKRSGGPFVWSVKGAVAQPPGASRRSISPSGDGKRDTAYPAPQTIRAAKLWPAAAAVRLIAFLQGHAHDEVSSAVRVLRASCRSSSFHLPRIWLSFVPVIAPASSAEWDRKGTSCQSQC
jgi:hypothetical protein